jgi:biotin carboxylase
MKRVYILGAGTMQIPAIDSAHRLGWEVVCADGNPHAAGRERADHFEHIDLKDEESLARSVCAWASSPGLDGVFTAGTDFSAAVAYCAGKAGLPGIPYRSALKATDKLLMREAFVTAGVPSPRFRGVASKAEGAAALEAVGLPAVVKPVDNMGARGIRRVDSAEDFQTALEEALSLSRSGRAIVEEYLEGPEFSLDALIYRGEFTLCGIADRHIRFAPYFVEIGHTMPTALSSAQRQPVVDVFRRGAAALGIENGAAKGDIKLTSRGPVVGEIAARLSGGYMSGWTYPLSSGVELTAAALRIAVGLDPGDLTPRRDHTGVERAFFSIPGRLAAVEGFGTDGAAAAFLVSRAGDEVSFPRNNVQKCGNYIYAGPERSRAVLEAEEACRHVLLRLEAGHPATLKFLRRKSFAWVPDAYSLENRENLCRLKELPQVPDADSIRREGLKVPLLPCLKEERAADWLGRGMDEALRQILRAAEAQTGPQSGNVGRPFWTAFLRGGLQGGLWYLDTLRHWAEDSSYGECVRGW